MKNAKEILTIEDHELEISKRADEIDIKTENALMREIVSALKATLKESGLTALSAPAIGYNKRIFVVDFKDSEIKTFINPIISSATGLQLSREVCSSIPGKTFIRPRNNDITIMYQRPLGQIETRRVVGLSAVVIQHELDHLDGLLLSDIGLEIDEEFDNATEEEREEVIKAYLDSLDVKTKEINKEVNADPELKQMSDAIDFMTSVYKGETKLEGQEEFKRELEKQIGDKT